MDPHAAEDEVTATADGWWLWTCPRCDVANATPAERPIEPEPRQAPELVCDYCGALVSGT